MRVALRLSRDLIALRAPADKLPAGQLLRVGESNTAAVLCARGGVLLASVLPEQRSAMPARISADAEASLLHGQVLSAPLGGGSLLGGRIIDCFGNVLDGEPTSTSSEAPLFRTPPGQVQLKPIDRSLHTGTPAIDALTPIGRGQSTILLGERGTGKSTIAMDAMLAQEHYPDVHCVLALSEGGVGRAHELMSTVRRHGSDALARRCTIVAGLPSAAAEGLDGDPSSQRLLVLAAAAAVGEAIRDGGGHAFVVADDLAGLCALWDVAGEAASRMGGLGAGAATDQLHSSEQRIFYASYLQRASQLVPELGGGSLTIFGLMEQEPGPSRPASSAQTNTASPRTTDAHAFTLDQFAERSEATRSRLASLVARGITLDVPTLAKLNILAPPTAQESALPPDGTTAEEVSAAREAHRRSVFHTDQLQSLADGHIQLRPELFAAGVRPAIRPSDSLARVGAGSTLSETRANPSTPAMQSVAQHLRLELAQARDLLPPSAADSVAIRTQRTRAAALEAVLGCQVATSPMRLSHQIVLLHCLAKGHLDHLAQAAAEAAGGAGAGGAAVQALVAPLLAHMDSAQPRLLQSIDATGTLTLGDEQLLLSCAAAILPQAGRQAFFSNWDPDHAYDTSKATPVPTSRERDEAVSELLRVGAPRRSLHTTAGASRRGLGRGVGGGLGRRGVGGGSRRGFGVLGARRCLSTQRTVAHIDGSPILIHNLARFYYDAVPLEAPAARGDSSIGDLTGFRMWECAPHLIRHIEQRRALVAGRTVLELGAGTGAVGLAAAACGAARVVLSDADSVVTIRSGGEWEERTRLASLADNVTLNQEAICGAAVSVEPLRWGEGAHLAQLTAAQPAGFETLIASDVLYAPREYDALAATVHALAAKDALVLIAFPVRHGDEPSFVERLAPAFERVSEYTVEGTTSERVELRIVELARVHI